MDLKVFVAAHKDYAFPSDPTYQPIHVGRLNAASSLPFAGDDTGDHISELNKTYCELTGLYWAWRNTTHEAYGLVHYRRYFAGSNGVATGSEMQQMLSGADVVVARRRFYVVETVRQQYSHAHHESDLDAARAAVGVLDAGALNAFDSVMNARGLSLYNMFLMRQPLLNDYGSWLFPILELAAKDIPLESYGPQQRRVVGYLGERLFNVWLARNTALRLDRHHVHNTEGEPKFQKGVAMLKRKLGHGRAV